MLNFCTLFDSNYLSRGLAMYESLKEHCNDFHLYVFAFDDKSYEVLNKLNLSSVTVISLEEFEDEELLKIKPTRLKAEYCWTCTSSTIFYVIKKYNVKLCTYLDADIYFYSSPEILLNELQDASVLITEHRYSEKYYELTKIAGKYCVQFISFRNNKNGLEVLNWWRNACIDWCYDRFENGKFGDQKYLDDWPDRFEGIHELQHAGGGLAPWNIQEYNIFTKCDKIMGKDIKTNKEFEVIFYHFHFLKFYTNKNVRLSNYDLQMDVKNLIYKPYIKHLEHIKENIKNLDNSFDPHGSSKDLIEINHWETPFRIIKRMLFKNKYRDIYNIYSLKELNL